MACVGGAPGGCAERCGGDRLCPLVLSLVLYMAVRHATDGARSANLDALGCLPGRTCRVDGAQPFDLVEFYRWQIRCDWARRVAGVVLASRYWCCDGLWRCAVYFSDCFPQFDAGGVDCDRPHLRLGATATVSVTGDCRWHLRDRAP